MRRPAASIFGMMRLAFCSRAGCFLWIVLLFCPCPSYTEVRELNESQMSDVYCQGATNLYIEDNTVRLFLDVHTETYGEIDSAKAGYYERNGSYDWDMNWTGITLGESMDAPLVTDGLVIRTEFDDINATDKKLTRIMIGTNNMDGRISGEFRTTTGAVNPEVVGEETGDPIVLERDSYLMDEGHEHLDVSDSGFFIDINFDGDSPERGIKTIVGYPESQAMNFTFGTDWWNE